MQEYVIINGDFFKKTGTELPSVNRSNSYGNGVFETIKVMNQKIVLGGYHFERLFHGLEILGILRLPVIDRSKMENEILGLCIKNRCEAAARVRLTVSAAKNHYPEYTIECRALPADMMQLNQGGWMVDIYPGERKSKDRFSNLKLSAYKPYGSAVIYARENNLDDCLVLNTEGNICDSTIANVFWVKNNTIYTPPLSEGCIAGVMRRLILDSRPEIAGFDLDVQEAALTENELKYADEIFLTNAIRSIRWVGGFRDKKYTNRVASLLYSKIIQTISG